MYRTTKKTIVKRGSISAVVAIGTLATGIGIAGASGHASTGFSGHENHSPNSHQHDGAGRHHGIGGLVTAVSATSITIQKKGGAAATSSTFTLDGSTTVTKGHTAATLADLAIGERVMMVLSTTTTTTPPTVASIKIVPAEVGKADRGVVTAASATSITIQSKNGLSTTFAIDASTKVMEERTVGAVTDLVVGQRVRIEPSASSPTTAGTIEIDLAEVAGRVASVSGNTIVVTTRDGSSRTIVVGPSTTYTKGGVPASLTDVTVGSFVFAEGLLGSDHTTLNATVVGIGQKAFAGEAEGHGPLGFGGESSGHHGGNH